MFMFKTTHIHARIWLSLQPWGLCLSFDCTHIEWPCSKPPTSTPEQDQARSSGACVQVLTVQVLRDYSQNHPHPHQNRTKPAALGAVCVQVSSAQVLRDHVWISTEQILPSWIWHEDQQTHTASQTPAFQSNIIYLTDCAKFNNHPVCMQAVSYTHLTLPTRRWV